MTHAFRFQALAVAAVAASLTACANYPAATTGAPVSTGYPTTTTSAVQFGRVTNVELVGTQGTAATGIGVGSVVGGVVGGVLGNQVGKGTGRSVATVVGVVGGALIGNAIEKNQMPGSGGQVYRVTVQQDNGVMRSFDYAVQPNVMVGDRVRVENNQLYR